MDITQQKKRLRKEMKEIMSFIMHKAERSEELLKTLLEKKMFQNVQTVSIFITLDDEVDTMPIVEYCWQNDIVVTVPEFQPPDRNEFVLRDWKKDDHLYETHYGIFHPKNSSTRDLSEIDLVFVPGMAFSKDGKRLGRGKGFYDRLLALFNGKSIGLCFKEQLKEKIPFGTRDMMVSEVIAC